jgi:tripartite-type tricarboxylate transporter receptor subunit TctC/transposase InsO family protein
MNHPPRASPDSRRSARYRVSDKDNPVRPVHLVEGYPPGLTPDIVARLVAQSLSERLGQQFIVDNRPGAGSNLAAELVVRAAPDGYTLLVMTITNAVNATLYKNLTFDIVHDIASVVATFRSPLVMIINPSMPFRTVPEFIAYAKANPGKINYGSPGYGTANHMAGELFRVLTGIELVHIPYRGSYMPDLLAGQTQVTWSPLATSYEFVKAGKLVVIAVTGATRSEALPDIPAVAETVPGYEYSVWHGIGAPKDTPTDVIGKLNAEINKVLVDPKIKERFAEVGGAALGGSAADYAKLIADETVKWEKVVLAVLVSPFKSKSRLEAENAALRHQLTVLRRMVRGRVQLTNDDRVFLIQLYRWFPLVLKAITIIRPETLVRWHRAGFRRYWRWKSRSLGGRPQIDADLRALIRRISVDNPLWGAPRIHGELLKLGFEVAQSSIAKYMVKRRGPPSQRWRTFLCNHAPDIAAMDLFVVPTIGFDLLYAIVIVRLMRRDLAWINVTANPTAEWIARQITEAFSWDEAPRYLIRDRDRVYGAAVTRRLRAMGIRDKPIAPGSPWQNGFAERLIGSIRRECADHVVALGEGHFTSDPEILRALL